MTEYAEEIERGGRIFKQVGKDKFYESVKELDVHPRVVTSWPYEAHWINNPSANNAACVGVSIGRDYHSSLADSFYVYYLRKDRL